MKKRQSKGIIPAVLLPLLLISANAFAGEEPATFLGLTFEDFLNFVYMALGVAAISALAYFTSRGGKKEKEKEGPQQTPPVVRKPHHHHHHHRVHRIKR